MKSTTFKLEVWGDLACFTRPEAKVERLSYPVMTPSAARGIFDAIFCNRHQMWWQIRQIEVLNDPKFIALRRNEVKGRAPADSTISGWINGRQPQPLMADGDDEATGRTQRQTIALKDVRYRLSAEIRPWPGFESKLPEFQDKFRRKAKAGQCLYQPYLGCREFPAFFEFLEEPSVPASGSLNLDIGWMVYDVFQLDRPGASTDGPAVSLFRASVSNGVLAVPEYHSPLVQKVGGPDA